MKCVLFTFVIAIGAPYVGFKFQISVQQKIQLIDFQIV